MPFPTAADTAAFLDSVGRLTRPPTDSTMVLLRRPAYRAALAGYQELHREIAVRLDDPRLEAPLEKAPYLYQTWGALLVLDALLQVGRELGLRCTMQRILQSDGEGLVVKVLPDGQPAVVLVDPERGVKASFIPQRRYTEVGKLRAHRFAQIPDVAIEIEHADGRFDVLIFDPKYKLEGDASTEEDSSLGPRKADIDKMHAYRNAIRSADGELVVRLAAILYPGEDQDCGPDVGALGAHPDAAGLGERLRGLLRRYLAPGEANRRW